MLDGQTRTIVTMNTLANHTTNEFDALFSTQRLTFNYRGTERLCLAR